MFISRISLKNFGKVGDKTYLLEDGLTIVRGANEAAKTTSFITAPLYAFFGARAIDGTVEELVKDGEKPSSMKVEVDYGPYTVKRSPSGASVTGPEVKISGQTDVSEFFGKLFGVQVSTAGYVIVAEQGDVAGIFKKPAGEVTSFIENLAGFSEIDGLIERVQEAYPSGMKKILQDNLVELEAELEEANAIDLQPTTEFTEKIELISGELEAKKDIRASVEESVTALEKELATVTTQNTEREKAKITSDSILKDITRVTKELEANKNREVEDVSDEELEAARNLLEKEVPERQKDIERWNWVKETLSNPPADIWDSSLDELLTAIDETTKLRSNYSEQIASAKGSIQTLRADIPTESVCSRCGAEVKDFDKIINSIEEKCSEHQRVIDDISPKLVEATEDLRAMKLILEEHNRLEKSRPDGVLANESQIPYVYYTEYEKPEPVSSEQINHARSIINTRAAAQSLSAEIAATDRRLNSELSKLLYEKEKLTEEINSLGEIVDTTDTEVEIKGAREVIKDLGESIESLTQEKSDLEKSLLMVENENKRILQLREGLEKKIAKTKHDLSVDTRNSCILKAVREAKPKVLNMIWSQILFALNKNFSRMRGVESNIEKTATGFTVDGLSVRRQSGSTKSILGVAMREALKNTFAPTCGFILFDEVFADMDADRTAATLAAISGMNGQKLIITHEDVSEMLADNFIEVEA